MNYRANIYALKSLGCNSILSFSACGSLNEKYHPGDFVLVDQYLDLTRKDTIHSLKKALLLMSQWQNHHVVNSEIQFQKYLKN